MAPTPVETLNARQAAPPGPAELDELRKLFSEMSLTAKRERARADKAEAELARRPDPEGEAATARAAKIEAKPGTILAGLLGAVLALGWCASYASALDPCPPRLGVFFLAAFLTGASSYLCWRAARE